MILPRYRVAASRIEGAGKGLFLAEPVAAGRVVIAPDRIDKVYKYSELPHEPALQAATVRWFEDCYTVTPEWPDECYINHAFAPTGLWHLGFVFARRDLDSGSEITVDYRHLLAAGEAEAFRDATTGERIVGFGWAESLARTSAELSALLVARAAQAA